MVRLIKLIVLDIDGVLTDGFITIDKDGNEHKKINMKDMDAISELKQQGFLLGAVTGEKTAIVNYFEKRFPWNYFIRGNKSKKEALQQIEIETGIQREHICYVGDGKYDVGPLEYAGLGLCPANAVDRAKAAADIVLKNNGGDGCIWEILAILENYNQPDSLYRFFYQRSHEHTMMFRTIASNQRLSEAVMECGNKIIKIFHNNGQLFLCGNGGSAADAQHIATEFVSRFYKERPGLNAEALTVNTSTLTAVSNDYSFERVFVRQLEAKAHSGDMLIGITTSGRSKNVVEALKYAKKIGMFTALMMGNFEVQHTTKGVVDYLIKIPSDNTPRIQEVHIFLGHVMAEYVEHEMFE